MWQQLITQGPFGSPFTKCQGVDEQAYSLSDMNFGAWGFVTYYMIVRIKFLVLTSELFIKSDKRLELDKYESEGDALQFLPAGFIGSLKTALNFVVQIPA